MSPDILVESEHADALAARLTIADKIRYACEHVDPPTTHEVRQWLSAYGVTTTRSYTTSVISTWRREQGMGDTGDLVAMTPELLAELDALRPAAAAPEADHDPAADTMVIPKVEVVTPKVELVIPKVETPAPAAPGPDDATPDTADAEVAEPVISTAPAEVEPAADIAEETGVADPSADAGREVDEAEPAELDVDTRREADSPREDAEPAAGAERAPDAPGDLDAEAPARNSLVAVVDEPPVVGERIREAVETPVVEAQMTASGGRVPRVLSWASSVAWIVVLIAAMGISWWSLFEYARGFSIPTPLAAVVSLVFDASALIVAGLAHRYALSPYSGAGPRIALLALLAGSVYLNWEHAAGKGYGIEASIMFAAPAAVGILLFELHIGWHSRTERRARGRVARPLPVVGAWGWLLHPLQSITTFWRVTHARGRVVRENELSTIDRMRATP